MIDNEYDNCIEKYIKRNNFNLYSELYLDFNEEEKQNVINVKKGELICSNYDRILICNKCFCCCKYLINNDKPSYKEPPKEISFYAYRRINHFKRNFSSISGKESTDIPIEIIEHIQYQIKSVLKENLTNKKTKEILKKLGYNKYCEHITFYKR